MLGALAALIDALEHEPEAAYAWGRLVKLMPDGSREPYHAEDPRPEGRIEPGEIERPRSQLAQERLKQLALSKGEEKGGKRSRGQLSQAAA